MSQNSIMKKDGKSGYSLRKTSILLSLFILLISILNGCAKKVPVEEEIVIDPITDFISYVPEPTNKEITVNGVKTTEISLKEQYGDLYRWVEPLTERQIEEQFQEIYNLHKVVWDSVVISNMNLDLMGNEYVNSELSMGISTIISQQEYQLYLGLYNKTDSVFTVFKSNLNKGSVATGNPRFEADLKMTGLLKGESQTLSIFEKEVYVRYMRTKRDLFNKEYVKQGITYKCSVCEAGSK